MEQGAHDPTLSTLVRLARALRIPVTELLGESVSASQWWQVGEDRFSTRQEAEEHARTLSEMFIVRFQNKPGGPLRQLLPVRETK
jgi:transcriptional regulator with XRE-family HTH domain